MTIALIELSQELNLFRGELRLHVGFLESSHYTIVTRELPHPLNVRPTSAGQASKLQGSLATAIVWRLGTSLPHVSGFEEQCQLELLCRGLDAATVFRGLQQQLGRPPPGIAFLIVMQQRQDKPGGIAKAVK